MKLDIQTIPHKQQRYDTVGDYFYKGNSLKIRISQMHDERFEWLVLIHELIEYVLISLAGVPIEKIDEFDKEFEENRENCQWGNEIEPGNDRLAPYYEQHQAANIVERVAAYVLGVEWDAYNNECINLKK